MKSRYSQLKYITYCVVSIPFGVWTKNDPYPLWVQMKSCFAFTC